MSVKQAQYEELLAECSDHSGAIELLKHFRPYLELIPSMRRPSESVIPIPLPLARIRRENSAASDPTSFLGEAVQLPCDLAILMCDPEWKIKAGVEILVFIHHPQEDFSNLLSRWRKAQILLDRGYEWLMPDRYDHLLSDGSDEIHPLFVLFTETPDRIRRGLRGAGLPFIVQTVYALEEDEMLDPLPPSKMLQQED